VRPGVKGTVTSNPASLAAFSSAQIPGHVAPWPWLDVVFYVISAIAHCAGFAALVAFAGLFGRPLGRARLALSSISVLLVAYYFSSRLVALIVSLTACPDPYSFIGHKSLFWGLSLFALFICLVWACVASQPAERPRAIWSTFAVGPLLLFVTFVAWSGVVSDDVAVAGYPLVGVLRQSCLRMRCCSGGCWTLALP
jgi:hypothetical protein